jgi:hypothetical protein
VTFGWVSPSTTLGFGGGGGGRWAGGCSCGSKAPAHSGGCGRRGHGVLLPFRAAVADVKIHVVLADGVGHGKSTRLGGAEAARRAALRRRLARFDHDRYLLCPDFKCSVPLTSLTAQLPRPARSLMSRGTQISFRAEVLDKQDLAQREQVTVNAVPTHSLLDALHVRHARPAPAQKLRIVRLTADKRPGGGGSSEPAEEMQLGLGAGDIEMSHRLDKRNSV